MKHALILAAQESRTLERRIAERLLAFSRERSSNDVCTTAQSIVADTATVKTEFESPQRLRVGMSLDDMILNFERKLRNPDYRPVPMIEANVDATNDSQTP